MKLEITNLKGEKEMINVNKDIYDKIDGIKMKTYDDYYPPRPIPNINKGWECPNCKMIYSPMIKMCGYCSHANGKTYVPVDTYSHLQVLNEAENV